MKPIKVNTKVIKALKPCQDRLDNWLTHYSGFNDDLHSFLSLDKITARDKIWVSVRLMPRELIEVFVIDCAFAAVVYADAAAAARAAGYAAYAAAAYAAYAADYAADAAAAARAADAAAYADAYAAYAADNAAAGYAAYAAAGYAAYAADYAADAAAAEEDQVDCLIYLIS